MPLSRIFTYFLSHLILVNLDYFLLEEGQVKPDLQVTQPLKFGYLIKNAFTLEEIKHYTRELHRLPWKIQEITVAGKRYMPKRETLGFAAENKFIENRSSFGILFPSIIEQIRNQTRQIIGEHLRELGEPELNYCWGNRYRDGNDKVGKHKDNEKWHRPEDPIVSVSFGEYRHFDVLSDYGRVERFDLGFGDIFLMLPGFQQAYYHAVPTQKTISSSRINLTFRSLVRPPKL